MGSSVMDKAVILARGLGTRMRRTNGDARLDTAQEAIADTGVKALIPIGRPFLDYVLFALADAGYRRICLVIGPEHNAMRDYFGRELSPERLTIDFAVQSEPRGTSDAVAAARTFADGEHFLCINSDNYYPVEAMQGLREIDSAGLAGFERKGMLADSNIPGERIVKFAAVEMGADGCMKRILEKPSPEALAALGEPVYLSMNCWRFTPEIFEACEAIEPSPRGELEVTDAVQYAIDTLAVPFRVLPFSAPVLDLSSRSDVAGVRSRLAGMEVRL